MECSGLRTDLGLGMAGARHLSEGVEKSRLCRSAVPFEFAHGAEPVQGQEGLAFPGADEEKCAKAFCAGNCLRPDVFNWRAGRAARTPPAIRIGIRSVMPSGP